MSLKSSRWVRAVIALPLLVLAIVLLLNWAISLWIDATWFNELGYVQVWALRLAAPGLVWLVGWLVLLPIVGSQIHLAWPGVGQWGRRGRLAIVLLLSALLAGLLASQWFTVLCWLKQVPVGTTEPVFNHDIGFYLFSLPLWQLLQRWSLGVGLLIFASVGLIYLRRSTALSQPPSFPLQRLIQRHLLALAGGLFLLLGWGHWLSRYTLLYSNRGSFTGANYTDIQVQLPANTFLVGVCIVSALACCWLALRRSGSLLKVQTPVGGQWDWRIFTPLLLIGLGYGLSVFLIGRLYPAAVQKLVVLPNELERDRPYIERNIQFTRQGFNLTQVDLQPFTVRDTLKISSLSNNAATLKNIRLWDSEPLLQAYRQLQEIRPYYQFPSVDVDRYTIDGTLRQVMHSARELDFSLISERAQTWVNRHFFYTHGYGITLSPVNVVTRVGLPDFFIKDIPPRAVNPAVESAIPIKNSAIYYGELTDTDVYVNTRALELDYPQAEENIYGSYQGTGGMPVGQFWQRLLYAWHFRDARVLLSDEFTPQSKLLFRRQILTRVKTVAPFLTYDRDPYMVATDGNLYWVLDAYTTSDRFPYSEPADPPNRFNYIRNSVKVVVDAYHGSVNFYVADAEDAIVKTYRRIYPQLFQPLENMSASLRQHLRYPIDLFQVQTQQYATYHMSDPQVFYNKEDLWQIPQQVRPQRNTESFNPEGLEQNLWTPDDSGLQTMQPYYLILELSNLRNPSQPQAPSTSRAAEFVLLSPFTPANKQNLIAWMAARCDGEEYGKLLVYEFSRQSLVFGPQQVEARINQDPLIAQQISLWNQQGSRVNRGSLLIIPVEESLLYVQPLYLEAEDSRLPELTRVIVAYEDQVVMQPTLEDAFRDLFGETAPAPAENETAPTPEAEPPASAETAPAPTE